MDISIGIIIQTHHFTKLHIAFNPAMQTCIFKMHGYDTHVYIVLSPCIILIILFCLYSMHMLVCVKWPQIYLRMRLQMFSFTVHCTSLCLPVEGNDESKMSKSKWKEEAPSNHEVQRKKKHTRSTSLWSQWNYGAWNKKLMQQWV